MTIEEELAKGMRQTMRATRSRLTALFNLTEFALMDLLPRGTSFAAVCFVDNAIIPLVNRHTWQRRDIVHRKLHLDFDNCKSRTTRRVQEEMTSHRCVRVPDPRYSRDLGIADC